MEAKPREPVGYTLALETSGVLGGVALGRAARIMEVRTFDTPRQHAAELLPIIDALVRKQGLAPPMIRSVYVSQGPGSFTGLRIGITAARMLALGLDVKLVGVGTLQAIAHNALAETDPAPRVAVITDAGRGRVYAARFSRGDAIYLADDEPAEVDPAAFIRGLRPGVVLLGDAVDRYGELIRSSGLRALPEGWHSPRVEAIYELGSRRAAQDAFVPREALLPIYIRPPEAEEKWAKRNEGAPRRV